ncbi:MAG TPA: hypothetical protein VFJ49_06515, partial [Methyloceanibacter sp.]|nr:hypothetical protein [Methyloceanibacter sp.]
MSMNRIHERRDQRRRTALDAVDLVALAEHRKWLAEIGGDEIHQIEAGLVLGLERVLDVVSHIEQID